MGVGSLEVRADTVAMKSDSDMVCFGVVTTVIPV
jgi:hypothetical protein